MSGLPVWAMTWSDPPISWSYRAVRETDHLYVVLRHAASRLDETAPILISFYDRPRLPVVARFVIK